MNFKMWLVGWHTIVMGW